MLLFAHASCSIGIRDTTTCNEDIRINQLQVIDTHNSYRVGRRSQKRKIIDRISSIIQRISSLPQISTLPIASSLGNVRHLQVEYYSHEYIYSQLEHQSVRSLEFDLRTDDNGKLYSRPSLWKLLKLLRVQPPFDSGMFNTSGIKVFHSKDLDLNPVCHIFKDCLHQTNRWSDAHRTHVPIIVSLELKTDTYLNGTAKKLSKSRSRMESPSRILNVDTEILSVFPLKSDPSPRRYPQPQSNPRTINSAQWLTQTTRRPWSHSLLL